MITIIVAKSKNDVIGMGNTIPWHLPADLKHFKTVTKGHTVIMGRLTWESLPKRPLGGRRNIVITSNPDTIDGAEAFTSVEEALSQTTADEQIFIIGGQQLYSSTLPLVNRLIVSEVDITVEGDRFFAKISEKDFTEVSRTAIDDSPLRFEVVTYMRKKPDSGNQS